ncbi:Hypothetical predicted protein, partial [Paramuricea clavata]
MAVSFAEMISLAMPSLLPPPPPLLVARSAISADKIPSAAAVLIAKAITSLLPLSPFPPRLLPLLPLLRVWPMRTAASAARAARARRPRSVRSLHLVHSVRFPKRKNVVDVDARSGKVARNSISHKLPTLALMVGNNSVAYCSIGLLPSVRPCKLPTLSPPSTLPPLATKSHCWKRLPETVLAWLLHHVRFVCPRCSWSSQSSCPVEFDHGVCQQKPAQGFCISGRKAYVFRIAQWDSFQVFVKPSLPTCQVDKSNMLLLFRTGSLAPLLWKPLLGTTWVKVACFRNPKFLMAPLTLTNRVRLSVARNGSCSARFLRLVHPACGCKPVCEMWQDGKVRCRLKHTAALTIPCVLCVQFARSDEPPPMTSSPSGSLPRVTNFRLPRNCK